MIKRMISAICALSFLWAVICGNNVINVFADAASVLWSKNTGSWSIGENSCTAISQTGWNKAYSNRAAAEDFTLQAEISYSSGDNRQYFIYFGAAFAGANAYSLRIQLNSGAGTSNICVYDDSSNKRQCAWTAFPDNADKDDFILKLSVENSVAKVYINGLLICTTNKLDSYGAGFCGFGTYKTAAAFSNIVFTEKSSSVEDGDPQYTPETAWVQVKNMTVSGNSGTSTVNNDWSSMSNPAVLDSNEDFLLETDVKYVSGTNLQYFVHFGLEDSTQTSGGFSVRIQLSDAAGNNNICIYNDAENKRLCSWTQFPESANKNAFKLKLRLKDGNVSVYIDGEPSASAKLSGYSGGCTALASYKTAVKFDNISFLTAKEHMSVKTYIANEDFSDFTVSEHGTQTNGNLTVISSDNTSSAVITDEDNKYLSLARQNAAIASNCLLQFYDSALTSDTYVIQFDVRLNSEIALNDKVNLLIGRKTVGGKGVFEYILNVSEAGYLYCTTGALGSTTLGQLSSDEFSNIAVVINDRARTYDVYLNGTPAIKQQSFMNDSYAGLPSSVQTMFRIALGEKKKDVAVDIDNFKVYTGDKAENVSETEKTIVEQFDSSFEKLVFTDSRGTNLNYRFYLPESYDPTKKYPVVLAMHGAGLWGNDNDSQLNNCFNFGVSLWHNRDKYDCIIIVPQTQNRVSWVTGDGIYPWYKDQKYDNYDIESFEISQYLYAVTELLDSVCQNYSVDKNRQYIGGFSMGGYATWYLLMMYPERFAAAVPTCAGSDPEYAKYIKDIPIWTFHSTDDETVDVEATRAMVSALKALGGNIKYTEFTDFGHNVWDYAFQSDEVLDWMFSQRRTSVTDRNTLEENVKWKTETPELLTITTNWIKNSNGYSATGAASWNKAVLNKKLDSGSFVFETEINKFRGEQLYVYFGLPDNISTNNGYSVRFQFGESAGNNNIAVYKDADKKRVAGWTAFPSASSRESFKLRVEMSGKLITILIDGKIVLTTDYLTDYVGGYIGIATNKAVADFVGISITVKTPGKTSADGETVEDRPTQEVYYPKAQNWNLITSNWRQINNGYSSKGNSGWSKSAFSTAVGADEDFIFEADISDFTGDERQLYIYFGLPSAYSTDGGYSLRIQMGKTAGASNAAIYNDIDGKRIANWIQWPQNVSSTDFHLLLKIENKRLMAYAEDTLLFACDIPEFSGGFCGLSTNKAGADIKNVTIAAKSDKTQIPDESYSNKTVDLKLITETFEKIRLGLYPTNINGWNKAVSSSPVTGNFKFDADIEYISGSLKQYYFYFGLPDGESLDGGYSVRIQLNGESKDNNIAVYNDTEKKRVSSWVKFPADSDKDLFHLTVKISNKVAVVYIDGKIVCTSSIIESGTDGYYGLALNRTSGKVINMVLSVQQAFDALSPQTGDNSNPKVMIYTALISLGSLTVLIRFNSAVRRQNR